MYDWKNKSHMYYACEGCDRLCVIVSPSSRRLHVYTANCIRLRRQLAAATGKKKTRPLFEEKNKHEQQVHND